KLAQSVGVGFRVEASQFTPLPIRLAGSAAALYLGVSFYRDMFDANRWNKLGEAFADTWKSDQNTSHNFAIVQDGLGHLAFDTALMFGGAKLGCRLGEAGIKGAMSLTGFSPQAMQTALTDLLVTPAQEIPRIRCGGQMKGAAVHARTFNGVSIGSSVDGQNTLIGDGRGSLVHMRAGNGASPAEVSNLAMANGFTSLVTEDALAYDAA